MQTATFFAPQLATKQPPADPIRASVGHLLSRAYSLPCSTAAQAFTQLVQPTSRFQYALDVLMPLLETHVEVSLASASDIRAMLTDLDNRP